jgi:hypothetical protein
MGWVGRRLCRPPAGEGGLDASPRGGVGLTYLHKRCHSVILAGRLAGLRGMGWAGRRLCRPPAGEGGLDARPCRGAGGKVGRFLRKRRGRCGRLGDRSPTLGTLGEVGMDREDSFPTGRWAAPVGREGGSGWGTPGRGTPAFRVTLRVGGALQARGRHRAVSVFRYGWIRERLGILRCWECGPLDGAGP